jgi:hypothetical protein
VTECLRKTYGIFSHMSLIIVVTGEATVSQVGGSILAFPSGLKRSAKKDVSNRDAVATAR